MKPIPTNSMHILHFMNIPLHPEQLKSRGKGIYSSGGWMAVMIGRMLTETDFRFTCVSIGKTGSRKTDKNGRIECIVLPNRSDLRACRDLVRHCKPDLIHTHGTEQKFGLLTARDLVKCPAIISLQGLLGPYAEWYHYFGNRSVLDIIRMHRWLEIPAFRGQLFAFLKTRKNGKREREIISGNRFFMGRTAWDRAYIRAYNPSAHYFHGGELLRDAFWQKRWDIERAKRHRLIFTNAGHPRKGTELLLDAVKILKPRYPDIHLRIAGGISRRNGYGRYLRKRIDELDGTVVELGPLNAEAMAGEMLASHVFISPSFIDNSPNAVCEAQLLGMPVISTYTGGVPTLIEDRRTGLLFPTGDAPMLADKLREVFEDDAFAAQLGTQAHSAAILRHDPGQIIRTTLAVYKAVLSSAT